LLYSDIPNCASLGCVLGIIKKTLARRGARALFRGIPTHSEEAMDF